MGVRLVQLEIDHMEESASKIVSLFQTDWLKILNDNDIHYALSKGGYDMNKM